MIKDIKIIRQEFHRSPEARYIHRLHGVLLVLTGLSTVKAGKLLGDPQRTIAHWVIQFEKHGIEGLQEAEKSGRPQKLDVKQKDSLFATLSKPPKEAGLAGAAWTNVLVAELLDKRYGVTLSVRQCTRLLKAYKDGRTS